MSRNLLLLLFFLVLPVIGYYIYRFLNKTVYNIPKIVQNNKLFIANLYKDDDLKSLFPIINISKSDFIKEMNKYPFQFYKSYSGIVGNHYDNDVREINGHLEYLRQPKSYRNYPPYHTVGSFSHNAYNLLNKKDAHYYIRFIGTDTLFMQNVLRPRIKFNPGDGWYSVSSLISNKGSYTNLHIDGQDGFQLTVFGSKRWLLFDFKDIKKLGFDYGFPPQQRSMKFTERINLKELPRDIKYREIITKKGDLVYIPASQPHCVETLEDFSVNIGWRRRKK